jgi:hypothetical protein
LYATALARYPDREPYVWNYLRTVANVANVLSNQGRYDDAIRVRQWLATKTPPTAHDVFQLGLVYLHRGDLERAAQSVNEALARFPDMPEAKHLQRIFPDLERERERIHQGRADDFAKVSYLARIGARAEATRLAAAVVARGVGAPAKRFELASYVAKFADYDVAAPALAKAGELPAPVVVLLDERRKFRADAAAARSEVEPFVRRVELGAILK